MSKFENSSQYHDDFVKVKEAIFYPYVGKNFEEADKKIMVFAHNIPVKPNYWEAQILKRADPYHFANALEEFTYRREGYTKTWRNFIKGALGLKINFTRNSPPEILEKVDDFVENIAYINFINDFVKTKNHNNAFVPKDLKEKSIRVNNEYLQILNITHCICWGGPVLDYMKRLPDFKVVKNQKMDKKGFELMWLENEKSDQKIKVLKVFHPSMPSFGIYKKSTHQIFEDFFRD